MRLPPGDYCAYLRKSRADIEAEDKGDEDTYVRHERMLFDLAKRHDITISKIYRERPISGERISSRPEMMKLLADIEEDMWTGVLVVEVERLARGDTMDQGIVAQAFKFSDTLIITPMRTFNPNDPNDEEYFEFNLFMSRREFKTINRRLQAGRIASVKEGNYIGSRPPYGYVRKKIGRSYSLEPHPEQAAIVKLIFGLYTDHDPEKRMGITRICHYLNDNNIPSPKGTLWIDASLSGILRNITYTGMVKWRIRPAKKSKNVGGRSRLDPFLICDGNHEALITPEIFEKATNIRKAGSHTHAVAGKVSNPMAGLVRCGLCGGPIQLRPNPKTPDMLICPKRGCKTKGSYLEPIEKRLLFNLSEWIENYKERIKAQQLNQEQTKDVEDLRLKAQQDTAERTRKKIKELQEQRNNLDDLLESKVYTIQKYMDRSKIIETRIAELTQSLELIETELTAEIRKNEIRKKTIPRIEHALKVYPALTEPVQKNDLLRSIIKTIIYSKEKGGRWSKDQDSFVLQIEPILEH